VTGIANLADELLAKQFQILAELLPKARRVAVLLNPANPVTVALKTRAVEIGKSKGWSVSFHEAQDEKSVGAAFGAIEKERADKTERGEPVLE